jgi:hypothetical protein
MNEGMSRLFLSGFHGVAETLLGIVAPVTAVELNEDGGVGNDRSGFENDDVELLSSLGDGRDEGVVRTMEDVRVAKEIGDLLSVSGSASGIGIVDVG